MDIKLPVQNIDLRDAQERIDDNVRQLRTASRKAILAYAGLWGMAYDEAAAILDRGKNVLGEAESRGESLEAEASKRIDSVRAEAQNRIKGVENRIEGLRGKAKKEATETASKIQAKAEGKMDVELEGQVERVLERLGIPSRERIIKLSNELEALSKKIDAKFGAQDLAVNESAAVVLPIADYDNLNVKEVSAALEGLTVAELVEVKTYEQAHENRVTVLRELNRRIEAMPIAGYDGLTVEEIEVKLDGLTVDELAYVAAYEKAHQNRVTLLRTVNSQIEEQKQA